MEQTGITKYNFTSRCIRRLLEIGNKFMIISMKGDLESFVNFISVNTNINWEKYGKEKYEPGIEFCIKILKIYKPFIPTELLVLINDNGYFKIFEYILSKNLHVPG